MDTPENLTLDMLDQIQIQPDENIDLCFGLLCTFYFKNSHTRELCIQAAHCINEYLDLFSEKLTLYLPPNGRRYKKFSSTKELNLAELIEKSFHRKDLLPGR